MPTEVPIRDPDGELLANTNVVACDVLAYLSGVNYGSVVKIIAAMHAMAQHTDLDLNTLAGRFESVPTVAPQPGNPAHRQRLRESDRFIRAMVKTGATDPYEDLLHARDRFGRKVKEHSEP